MHSMWPSVSMETAYGSLAFFSTLLHNLFLLYHVDMFVSIYKIDKLSFWIGEALFLIWNSLNDPLFGWMSDKMLLTRKNSEASSSSKNDVVFMRLSSIQFYGPLYAVAFCLFWVQWLWTGLQFAVCLCLYDGMLTMIDLHHSALLADMAVSSKDRTAFSSKCSIFSALGTASVFLSYLVWNKTALSEFRLFCFALAVMSFVGFWIMVQILRESYIKKQLKQPKTSSVPSNAIKKLECDVDDNASVQKFGRQVLSHTNFKWFAMMNLVQVFHCHFNSNFFPLFLDTLLGSAVSPGFASCLLGLSFVIPHINNIYFLSLCTKYSTYTVINGLLWLKLLLSVFMYFIGLQHLSLLCLFIASNRVFTEGTCRLLSLVITDLVDEDMVVHRRPQAVSALIFGTAALLSKPGQTFAPLVGTWMLTYLTGHDVFESGENSNSMKYDMSSLDPAQQQAYRFGVFILLTLVPICSAVVQLVAWNQFTLRGQRLASIKAARQSSDHLLYV